MTKPQLSKQEALAVEVLTARHRLGEPWWTFDTRHRRTLDRLAAQGIVEVLGPGPAGGIEARLSPAGHAEHLDPGWRPAVQRAQEALADDITDAGGMSWWMEQATRHGIAPEAVLAMATAAEESIRRWGRLIDSSTAAVAARACAAEQEAPEWRP